MKKKILLLIGIIVACILGGVLLTRCHFTGVIRTLINEKDDKKKNKYKDTPFIILGERLTYGVWWGKLYVGRAVMKTDDTTTKINGHEVYHISSTTYGNDTIQKIYPVKDRIETFIDVKNFCPWRFEKHISEGTRKKDEYIAFEQGKKAHLYRKKKGWKEWRKRIEYKIGKGTHDSLSSLYYMRKFSLKAGKKIKMKVAEGKKLWDMTIDVVKKEELKIKKLGTFESYLVIPRFQFEGMFVKRGDPYVWLDAKKGYPLMMEVKIPVIGTITVVLSKIENTKKPKR